MGILRPGRSSRRPFTFRGAAVILVRKGRMIAQAWPKKRGKNRPPWLKAQNDRLAALSRALRQVPADERALMIRELKKFMARNRGVRGTAAIRERDLQTSLMSGRLFAPTEAPNRRLTTAAVHGDITDILDWLEPRMGSMIVRTSQGWLPTFNCSPNRVLTMTLSAQQQFCCPNASLADDKTVMSGHRA